MSIKLVMPSNHFILCHLLLPLPSVFPSIRIFSNQLALCIRWPKYWSFSFSISSVQSLSHVQLFLTQRTAARQASLSFSVSQSLLKLMSIELVMPYNHLILCCPLLLLLSIFPSIRVFCNELAPRIKWPSIGVSASGSVLPMNIQDMVLIPPTPRGSDREPGLIPGLGRSLGEGNGYPLQHYCLESSMDRGGWQAIIHGVMKSWTQLNN